MRVLSILSGKGFVMFNKELAHKVSVNGSIIFGQLCSSHESFSNKGMITIRDGKEYFFLTSGMLEEETSLSYKQQVKAIKELADEGYIEARVMGSPSKKYFHITNKIIEELYLDSIPRNDKRSDLDKPMKSDSPRNDERLNLEMTKGQSLGMTKGQIKDGIKGTSYKENYKKNNKKEKLNNNTTSRSPNINIEKFLDKNLRDEFSNLPFDEIKYLMLKDESLIIKTEMQYVSMLRYRLENWSSKKQKKTNAKPEIVPDWFEKNKGKKASAPAVKSNIDEERRKLLEELNQ